MFFKKIKHLLLAVILLAFVSGCDDTLSFGNDPSGNFDALWTILDENYCFFDYKDIDWDAIYKTYRARVKNDMGNEALFKLMAEMLSELKDGHVNLIASHDMSRYWNWSEDYPPNFDASVLKKYLGTDYQIAGGINYTILEDNIGYMYYGSFSRDVGNGNMSEILRQMAICRGIIIDVRNNGGGSLTNVERIASRFFNEKTLVGYISHKIGKGHADFSDFYPKYIGSYDKTRYQKPVVVLTNRGCYSATNDFVNVMKHAPNATIVGDKTGGGSGLPFSSELPNGWSVRFSASPIYNVDKEHIEFGIEPDIRVFMSESDTSKGRDTIIERARQVIKARN
ncbi:MAG: S41 family peptidase [Bacteroidia bacterium]|nr:S41 family peptidase [Bacteroidia bacterium]